eukprot:6092465-Prymnesium_polylepis.1
MEAAMKTGDYTPPEEDLLKRANGNLERLGWLLTQASTFGDICPDEVLEPTMAYPTFFRQPFTNQAYRRERLTRGTVHVAV